MPEKSPAFNSNRILAKLAATDRKALAAYLTPIVLPLGEVLNEAGTRPEFNYFPVSGMISLVAVIDGRGALEVGLVGREGMTGISDSLGVGEAPARAIVQGKGLAIRIPTANFVEALKHSAALRAEAHRFAHATLATAIVVAACNIEHSLESRLARWLLMTRDRLSTTTFEITQEFLSQMLGVRRPSVNVVASKLQRRGLITYRRGMLKVLDAEELRKAACSCYPKIVKLSGPPGGANSPCKAFGLIW